jgi:hypothetical protein
MKVREDVVLSSGRVIAHSPESNGAQRATPTSGPAEMTDDEWDEYCAIIRRIPNRSKEYIEQFTSSGQKVAAVK